MTPELWQQIEELYHSALEHSGEERECVLAQAGPEVQREVRRLLAQDGSLSDLIKPELGTIIVAGAQLGPYRVEALIGCGGMGKVFRATDTRLDRAVAIKTSNEILDPRFERGARAISALNHPHVCTLYDVGRNYLVMELCEGETLAERLKRGKFTLEETLGFGTEIADALAAAHAKGIIHRDLKPGNIMLTKVGVKVLDFGLARSAADETITSSRMIIGTPTYMAPEQREGQECDARSDIFTLGLVLYEMAMGKRLVYGGAPSVAVPLGPIIEKCLSVDPDGRWQSASELRAVLEWTTKSLLASTEAPKGRHISLRWGWPIAIVMLALVASLVWLLSGYERSRGEKHTARLQINAPPGTEIRPQRFGGAAISPDGRMVSFVAASNGGQRLYLRQLESPNSLALSNTEGAEYPFWSPDSKHIGFFTMNGKLERIDVAGGPPTVICDAPSGMGGTWNNEDVILFAPELLLSPLARVPASGGSPTPVTVLNNTSGERAHRWPQFLPDNHRFLYFIRGSEKKPDGIYVGSLDRPQKKTFVMNASSNGVYLPGRDWRTGRLLWPEGRAVMAQSFDIDEARVQGEKELLADGVVTGGTTGRTGLSVSNTESIVYWTNRFDIPSQLTWLSRQGQIQGTLGTPSQIGGVRISPDGRRTAIHIGSGEVADLWDIEFARGVQTRLTFAGGGAPVWSPDSARIAYSSFQNGQYNLFLTTTARGPREERLGRSDHNQTPLDWSPDGRYLLYVEDDPVTRADLWVFPMTGDRKPFPYITTPFLESFGAFSPDGKWIAYVSDESGRNEVYVWGFPPGGPRSIVSSKGGSLPRWRRDGSELFYVSPDGQLFSVAVRRNGKNLAFGVPRVLLSGVQQAMRFSYPYDVTPDGNRILALLRAKEAEPVSLTVLLGWKPRSPH